MITMSSHYLHSDSTGILKRKEIATSFWYLITFRTHVFLGLVAITVGPTQFITSLRSSNKKIHRILGYLYIISVTLSSLAGLVIAPFAMGGVITTIGFSVLAILWFFATMNSVNAIVKGDLYNHQRWSYFSYALTFSAITQRTLLLVPLLTSVPFIPIYQLSAWLPWMLNILIAYSILRLSPSIKEYRLKNI